VNSFGFAFFEKMSLDAGGAAAKHGDQLAVLVRDLDVVDAAASALVARAASGRQCIAEMGRGDEVDVDAGGYGVVVEAVAGVGEIGVGEGENEAAVAMPWPLTMSCRLSSRPPRHPAWFRDHDAEALSGVVVGPHRGRAAFGDLLRSQCHVISP
jgi:hypothetical protein